MMVVLLVAGIGLLLAGLVAITFGIPVKEFSFGNTLILTGAIVACSGMILVGLWIVLRELKMIAQRLGTGLRASAGTLVPWVDGEVSPRPEAAEPGGFPFGQDGRAAKSDGDPDLIAPPWLDETVPLDRGRAPEPVEPEPAVKPRRNLLFSSSSRKERERALARSADPGIPPTSALPLSEPAEPPPATFDDAWPRSERGKAVDVAPPRRAPRAPSTFTEADGGAPIPDRHPPPVRNEEQPPVTVLKSGVVDGMAYSLYSDGSIEAQMPEGMMRFASIDELRAHLDQRP
jgi:hypothetical protein